MKVAHAVRNFEMFRIWIWFYESRENRFFEGTQFPKFPKFSLPNFLLYEKFAGCGPSL